MKRNSAETSIPASSNKGRAESADQCFGQIFSIARVEKCSTGDLSGTTPSDSKGIDSDRLRVGVSSKVNFSKLTSKEQLQRFQNQAHEIKRLRKKLTKCMNSKGKKESTELQRAVERIKVTRHELEDQGYLIENVVKAINTGKILPNTLPYNQICTILRGLLSIQCPQSKCNIKLPEATIPISTLEYEEYSKLPCTPGVLRSLIGKEQKGVEDLSELLRTLHLQAFRNILQHNNISAGDKGQAPYSLV